MVRTFIFINHGANGGVSIGFYIPVEPSVQLYVEDINPGSEKTILFIHGWPINHKMFEYQINQFPKRGYRCVSLDLRGFGISDRPWSGFSYDRLADDIHEVIKALQLSDITLAGFSVGGAIVIRYMARHHGAQVAKLALVSAAAPSFLQRPGFPHGQTRETVNQLIEQTYKDRPHMLNEFGNMFFARYKTEDFKEWFKGLGLAASGHATAEVLVSLRDEDLRDDLAKIEVPTTIFHGVQDQICPYPLAEAMHAGIRGSTLIPFELSGHGLYHDELETFNQEFLRFLAQP